MDTEFQDDKLIKCNKKYIRLCHKIKDHYLGKTNKVFSGDHLGVLATLSFHANNEGVCYRSFELIAAESGISINRIRQITRDLDDNKLIVCKGRGKESYWIEDYKQYTFYIPASIISSGVWRELSEIEKRLYVALVARSYDMHYYFYDESNDYYKYKYGNLTKRYTSLDIDEESSKNYKFIPFTAKFSNIEIRNVLKIKERKFYYATRKFSELGIVFSREVNSFGGYVLPINIRPCSSGIEHLNKVKERIRKRAELNQKKKQAQFSLSGQSIKVLH